MKKQLIYFLLGFSILSFNSCKKSDDVTPSSNSGSKEHYMPLTVGNTWTYNSASKGEYTNTITGTKSINNKAYFILTNSASTAATSYMRYDGNKLYSSSTVQGKDIELLMLDEDATEGKSWLAGIIPMTMTGYYSYNVKYTCTLVQNLKSYTVNGKTYSDIKVLNFKTTIENFELGTVYTSMYSGEELETVKTELFGTFQATTVNQTQYYSKGIGFVYQDSEEVSSLGTNLLSYTIK